MPRALLLDRAKNPNPEIREVSRDDLRAAVPQGDVVVRVAYSSLNYKDGLALTGQGPIVRGDFPFVPGIDLAGEVVESEDDRYAPGDEVLVTGWGVGENTWGGYAEEAVVRGDWIVPLPDGLSLRDAMVAGTAGFTAQLGVMALEKAGVAPGDGEVVVTGASGGAGSFAVALLAEAGYEVVASTGTESAHERLRALGAARFLGREVLGEGPARPMEKGRWAGALDGVGGQTLAALLAQTRRHGAVASYGNAGGAELHTTVFPFILRGVSLLGVDSNTCPPERRRRAWERLAALPEATYERIHARTVGLEALADEAERITQGKVQGRVVVGLGV